MKAVFTICLWVWAGLAAFGQAEATFYLNDKEQEVPQAQATFYRIKRTEDPVSQKGSHLDFYLTGEKKKETHFSIIDSVLNGESRSWYQNGQLASRAFYVQDTLHGKVESWFEGGEKKWEHTYNRGKLNGDFKSFYVSQQLKRHDVYAEGKLLEGHCYDENGAEVPYYPHEKMPEFPGGEKAMFEFLSSKLKVPFGMQLEGREGKAIISFVVGPDGAIGNIEVISTTHPSLGKIGVKAIKAMPTWEPGQQDGRKVSVKYTVPVKVRFN